MTPRRVVILRDTASPLHIIRCAEPCGAIDTRWCMPMLPAWNGQPADYSTTLCYLGGSMTEQGARKMAAVAGYEVAA